MFRASLTTHNTFLTASKTHHPLSVVKSREFRDPRKLVRYKTLMFTLGLDHQPLRRASIIFADMWKLAKIDRTRAFLYDPPDPTGFRRARRSQQLQWRRRMLYQHWYLEHLMTRQVWGVLRMYPPGGAKIDGVIDKSYFGYDSVTVNRYSREPLPATAATVYPPRTV